MNRFKVTLVVYHLLGRTGWSTVVVNGTRQIPNGNFQWDAACSISTTFSWKIGSKTIQAKRPGTSKSQQNERTFSIWKFGLGILVYLSRNPVFPRKFPFGETKLIFPCIYIPSEISGFFLVNGKQRTVNHPSLTLHAIQLIRQVAVFEYVLLFFSRSFECVIRKELKG